MNETIDSKLIDYLTFDFILDKLTYTFIHSFIMISSFKQKMKKLLISQNNEVGDDEIFGN